MNWTTADILTTLGALTIAGGAALIYPPAGLITLGVILGAYGVILDIAKRRSNRGRKE
jgi:hypothetical protein